jgi:hypothetical protein
MTWAEIKSLIGGMAPQAMSGVVSSAELAQYARMTHNSIAGHPYKFSFLFKEGSITMDGSASYNLKILLPDLSLLYLAKGDDRVPYQRPSDWYSKDIGSNTMTVMNNVIKFSYPPTSGTLTVPYYTKYLVIDGTTSAAKLDFENDDDYSIVPDTFSNLLIEGIMRFVWRRENKKAYTMPMVLPDGRITELDPFSFELQNAVLADTPISVGFTDFRFLD